MAEEETVTPMELVSKWLIANGKEATAFVVVMAAALFMFNDMRTAELASRQAGIEREARAWKHADEMKAEMSDLRESIKELTRALKLKK